MYKLSEKDIERYWTKIEKTPTCWLWVGHKCDKGYGMFKLGERNIRAHRLTYFLANGQISKELCVLHSCDVRNCVNPSHLSEGTHQENMRQAADRGRLWKQKIIPSGRCINGHELTSEGLMIKPDTKKLTCRKCYVEKSRRANNVQSLRTSLFKASLYIFAQHQPS